MIVPTSLNDLHAVDVLGYVRFGEKKLELENFQDKLSVQFFMHRKKCKLINYSHRIFALIYFSMHCRQEILIQILCEVDCLKLFHHWNGPFPRGKGKFMCTVLLD